MIPVDPPACAPPPPKTIVIELPFREVEEGEGYNANRIDTRLSPRQARALRFLYEGCDMVRIEGNRRIANPYEVVKYMLERVADAAGIT